MMKAIILLNFVLLARADKVFPWQEIMDDPEGSSATFECTQGNNTLGSCTCDQQLFIAGDCTKGFFCFEGTSEENGPYEGCMIECNEGYKLLVDPRNGGSWKCINTAVPLCPGKFNTECECNGNEEECPIGDCQCEGQLRVSQDCKKAKYCEANDQFEEISCTNETEIVYVDLTDNSWKCGPDDNRCPGAFHVGCQPDTTTTTTTTTTTATEGNGSNLVESTGVFAALAIALIMNI